MAPIEEDEVITEEGCGRLSPDITTISSALLPPAINTTIEISTVTELQTALPNKTPQDMDDTFTNVVPSEKSMGIQPEEMPVSVSVSVPVSVPVPVPVPVSVPVQVSVPVPVSASLNSTSIDMGASVDTSLSETPAQVSVSQVTNLQVTTFPGQKDDDELGEGTADIQQAEGTHDSIIEQISPKALLIKKRRGRPPKIETTATTKTEDANIIPGFDFIGDFDPMETSQTQTEAVAQIVSNLFSKVEKKIKPKKTKARPKPKPIQPDTETTAEEGEDSKIRRSSRIRTLETRRGGQRRREVVFSGSLDNLNRSLPNLVEDESNSSSSSSVPFGMTTSLSTPNILNSSSLFLGSPPRDTCTTTVVNPALSPASLLKLKSRWRYSSDAESLAPSGDSSLRGSSVDADMNLLSLSENQPLRTELDPNPTLVKKPGWILYDPSDEDLTEKLSKFYGLEENSFRSAQRTVSRESRGWLCDCYLSAEEIGRGDLGCANDCLNKMLMVECGSRCPTGERCNNKRFQRKEYCHVEVFKTERKGHGLRTRQTLSRGGFVIEYVGEVLDPREFNRRTKEYAKENQEHFYFMALKSDSIIDATQRGNCSRFINHSCEPNCETQKWTVNGELRIGFFAIRELVAGEEITFDYQFQRYGKEAQKCFCMAANCRGYIGGDENEEEDNEVEAEDYENEAERTETESSVVLPKVKRRYVIRKRKKAAEALEDIAFEEELSKLASTGLRNKNHTLSLCRLMVRAENWDVRERILNILVQGDTACRRLFLDYHGLRLIWGWMLALPLPTADSENTSISSDYHHKLFLKILHSLPIPNKSMLQDSKILSMIEKWSLAPSHSMRVVKTVKLEVSEAASSDSVIEETPIIPSVQTSSSLLESSTSTPQELEHEGQPESTAESQPEESLPPNVTIKQEPIEVETIETDVVSNIESNILIVGEEVTNVKEEAVVQEIMWEFVNEAKDLLSSWSGLQEVFRIPKKERVEQMKEHEREADKADRQRSENDRDRLSSYDRDSSRISKYRGSRIERRVSGSVIPDHHRERGVRDYHRRSSHNHFLSEINTNLSKEERRNLFEAKVAKEEAEAHYRRNTEEMFAMHQDRCARLGLDSRTTPIVDQSCSFYLDPISVTWKKINLEDSNLPPGLHVIVQAAQYPSMMMYTELMPDIQTPEPELFPPWPTGLPPPPPLPPATLPKNWKMNVDDEGRCYYYDMRKRQSQWTPPSPESVMNSESDESGEETEEESEGQGVTTSGEESSAVSPSQQLEEQSKAFQKFQSWMTDRAEKRKRSGLVSERIISPRSEEERSSFVSQKSICENKLEQLERKKQEIAETESIDLSGGKEVESLPVQAENNLGPRENSAETDEEVTGRITTSPSTTQIQPQKRREKPRDKMSSPGGQEKSLERTDSGDQALPDIEQLQLTECVEARERVVIPGLEETTPPNREPLPESPTTTTMLSIVNSPVVIPTPTAPGNSKAQEHGSVRKRSHKKSRHTEKKAVPGSSKQSRERERLSHDRKTKAVNMDNFRSQIANVIVQHLNPYRKASCKGGHIASTEDFKYLARKMTHSIALKELKHCKDGKTLIVSESVKHKTKEFVKKYMARFHGNYMRSPEEAQQT